MTNHLWPLLWCRCHQKPAALFLSSPGSAMKRNRKIKSAHTTLNDGTMDILPASSHRTTPRDLSEELSRDQHEMRSAPDRQPTKRCLAKSSREKWHHNIPRTWFHLKNSHWWRRLLHFHLLWLGRPGWKSNYTRNLCQNEPTIASGLGAQVKHFMQHPRQNDVGSFFSREMSRVYMGGAWYPTCAPGLLWWKQDVINTIEITHRFPLA